MSKPITKQQMSDLWSNEFGRRGHCCLCGNSGVIDTRGKMFTHGKVECGDLVFCICPNGRDFKNKNPKALDVHADDPS